MQKITITLDENTAAWARRYAAQRDMRVSQLVGELLRERMCDTREYHEAMRRYLSRGSFKLRGAGERYPTPDELHDRDSIR